MAQTFQKLQCDLRKVQKMKKLQNAISGFEDSNCKKGAIESQGSFSNQCDYKKTQFNADYILYSHRLE